MPIDHDRLRRRFLQALAATTAAGLATGLPRVAFGQGPLPLAPACDDGDEPTPRQTEGPFFTPDSPERADLREPGVEGTPITLAGFALTRDCRPIPGALVELWHADDAGRYDNDGYRLRGHQFTDAEGRYRFATIVPGLYTGRTRHFHLKYQAPNQPVLTTQLYFPGEPANQRDRIFSPELLVELTEGQEMMARFDAVLDVA
jgi:protocatechuate 3,4-dioxygenase beta subunit